MFEWLDKVIKEQAEYYGMSVEEFTRFMTEMAEAQELVERESYFAVPPV